MSSLTSFVSEAFEDHLKYLTVSIEVDGKQYIALPAEAELAPDLDIGGVTDQSDGGVILKKSQFGILPTVGSKIIIDGVASRIRSIITSAGNPLVQIEYSGFTER